MKTKNLLIVAALATTVLGGCSKSDEQFTNSNFPADGVMRFASSVETMQTRAGYDNSNITGQTIYLWVKPQGEANDSKYIYKSVHLSYSKNAWTAYNYSQGDLTPTTLLWKDNTTPVEVVANDFSAGSTGVDLSTDIAIAVMPNQSTEGGVTYGDKLYFKGIVDPSAQSDKTENGITTYALVDGKVRLPMKHLNSKVNITLTLGTEFSIDGGAGTSATNPVSILNVGGTYTVNTFDMTTGNFNKLYTKNGPIQSFPAAYTPAASTATKAVARYECILIPQTVTAGTFTVSFTLNGKPYKWVSTNEVKLESGKQYELALTVGKDVVQTGQFTSSEWTGTTDSTIETE